MGVDADPRVSPQGTALAVARVGVPLCDLVATPDPDQSPECQLVFGQDFRPYRHPEMARDTPGGWAFGAALNTLEPGRVDYVGWVRRDALNRAPDRGVPPATHRVSALRAPVFSRPDLKSRIRHFLPLGARVRADGDAAGPGGAYLSTAVGGVTGFVSRHHLRPAGAEWVGDFVDTAEGFQGLPYVWGGNGPDGMDCSGLVKLALESAGLACPRDADQQEAALGRSFTYDPMGMRRGDLVFWPGHVGVMQTSGRLLHANAHHMRVATEPLSEAVARIGVPRAVKRLG